MGNRLRRLRLVRPLLASEELPRESDIHTITQNLMNHTHTIHTVLPILLTVVNGPYLHTNN